MPTPRNQFNSKAKGSVRERILQLLADGSGYYANEILAEILCNERVMYRALSDLNQQGFITSKTTPEKGTKNKKLYFATDDFLAKLRFDSG